MKNKLLPFFTLTMLIALLLTGCSKSYPGSKKEKELTAQLVQVMLDGLAVTDSLNACFVSGIEACRRFLNEEQDQAALTADVEAALNGIRQLEPVPISQELIHACENSPYSGTDLSGMPSSITMLQQDAADSLEHLLESIELNSEANKLHCMLTVDCYERIMQENLAAYWYAVNEFFTPVTDQTVVSAFCEDVQKLPAYKELATDFAPTKDEALRLQEAHLQQIQSLTDSYALLVGQLQGSLNEQRDAVKQFLIEQLHASEERAQAYIDQVARIASKEQLLEEKKNELAEMQQKLEQLHQQMREKFSPLAEDESGILWGKATRFASAMMYEDAIGCLEMLKTRNDSSFQPECCDAGILFYRSAASTGYTDGIMILLPPPEGSMEPYQVADILVSINGQTFDDQHPFSSFDETRKGPYQAQVLRANDAGSLELIHLDIPEDIHFYCATL